MSFLGKLWWLIGLGVMLQYVYWGALYAGAWAHLNQPPDVSLDWLALGMFGAAFAAGENLFPGLLSHIKKAAR